MEQVQKRGLARLMLRWPAQRAELRRRFAQDPRLVELCEAYETACEAAAYWTKSPAPVGPERAEEYRALITATEQDILIRIS
ncbi:hypothetical protein DWF00_04055 [Bosea caraganae]|uniref:Uncharacterized protein n=1 Tax=Bosea caraganae TaxID=2763117 RepID=A0A370L5A6_9HYPH|nr:hypothetical protein [Bosea caraganae]RDJ24262.1 hypothetical protein DWE98_15285 [Bosea caraganae]RDJ30304.1 hypothetical protein DWF00_04055 [Bosea caraganae]